MAEELRTKETLVNYRACQASTREHAKSFYFASHVLPEPKRMSAYAVYAFCRHADNLVDALPHSQAPGQALVRMQSLRNRLHTLYTPSGQVDPEFLALHDTLVRYRIPEEYFLDLLRGVEMDLTRKRYANFNELREYCYCVASVVGLIMTRIFGLSDDEGLACAADLGTAMQLTNILRDIGEDYGMGRIYLPRDEMEQFGYSEEDCAQGIVNDAFCALMHFQIERARHYYDSAARGIPKLTNDGSRFCVRLMSGIYAGILVSIERNGYDVYSSRAHVPLTGKLRVAARALLPLGRDSGSRLRTPPRDPYTGPDHSSSLKPKTS